MEYLFYQSENDIPQHFKRGKWEETGESFHQEDAVDWIESDIKGEHNFALRVKGDSMEPELSSLEALGLVSHGEKLYRIRSFRSLQRSTMATSSSSAQLPRP